MKFNRLVSHLLFAFVLLQSVGVKAQIGLTKEHNHLYPKLSVREFKFQTPDEDKLRRKLSQQKALKGFGIFNIAWGGLWVIGGTVLAISSSEPRALSAVAIGAGAATMGLIRLKKTKRKIESIERQLNLNTTQGGIQLSYHF